MNKQFKKSILILGLSVLLTAPTFATSVQPTTTITQQLEANGYQYDQVMKVLKDGYNNTVTKPQSTYNAILKTVDKYGNILVPVTKYSGKFTAEQPVKFEHSDKVISNYVFEGTRAYYYKPINQKYSVNKSTQEINFTFVPTRVVNTVTGTVKFPEGTDLTNAWVMVKGTINGKLQDCILKVNKEGKFKVENLMDGTYTFTPFVGTLEDKEGADSFNYTIKFNNVTVQVKGNTVANIEATSNEKRSWLFEQADYSDLSRFTEISPMLELPQELKDVADKLYSEDTLQFLKNIFDYKSESGVFKFGDGPRMLEYYSVKEMFESKKLAGCTDHAVLVEAILRYKGVPTVLVTTARTDDYKENIAQGHKYLEIYLDKEGKWILSDTTANRVCLDYNVNNPFTHIIDDTMTEVIISKELTPEDMTEESLNTHIVSTINKLTHDLKLDPSGDNVNKQTKLK